MCTGNIIGLFGLLFFVFCITSILALKDFENTRKNVETTKRPATIVTMFSCRFNTSYECVFTCRELNYTDAICKRTTSCLCYNSKGQREKKSLRFSQSQEDCYINSDEIAFRIKTAVQRQACDDAGFKIKRVLVDDTKKIKESTKVKAIDHTEDKHSNTVRKRPKRPVPNKKNKAERKVDTQKTKSIGKTDNKDIMIILNVD